MAKKNTNLNGTDWLFGEILVVDDLNDTFDAYYNFLEGNSY